MKQVLNRYDSPELFISITSLLESQQALIYKSRYFIDFRLSTKNECCHDFLGYMALLLSGCCLPGCRSLGQGAYID
ncbi:hypothetical protein ACFOQM_21845 [Paenibacillus sp. GCM10012307]|uniref:Uncharacterized protein n=1 Tax=Paenibacillus roseus TaxID=2798579 RepID=A0A934J965_9BACL|nr:hypothetical protein [Paenibacillus roseus]MBJ6363873.1 hypothetical protein [Paenibacillus roseus]